MIAVIFLLLMMLMSVVIAFINAGQGKWAACAAFMAAAVMGQVTFNDIMINNRLDEIEQLIKEKSNE